MTEYALILNGTTILPVLVFTNVVEADVVRLSVDPSNSAIYCHLLSSYVRTKDAVCSITYGESLEDCDRYTNSSITTTGQPGVNLTIPLIQEVNIEAEFCYTVSLTYGFTKIKIVGNFTECNPSILNKNRLSVSGEMTNKMCNCYGVWSQRTQVCEEEGERLNLYVGIDNHKSGYLGMAVQLYVQAHLGHYHFLTQKEYS